MTMTPDRLILHDDEQEPCECPVCGFELAEDGFCQLCADMQKETQ